MTFLTLFAASALHIGLKAMQQLNVFYDRVWWIGPTCLALGAVEVFVIANVAERGHGWDVILPVASGSTLGCLIAMKVNRKK